MFSKSVPSEFRIDVVTSYVDREVETNEALEQLSRVLLSASIVSKKLSEEREGEVRGGYLKASEVDYLLGSVMTSFRSKHQECYDYFQIFTEKHKKYESLLSSHRKLSKLLSKKKELLASKAKTQDPKVQKSIDKLNADIEEKEKEFAKSTE